MLLDTGCRITEALTLRVSDVDFDNLLLLLDGKGRKQRKVPFSFELRKALFRHTREFCPQQHMLVLGTRDGCKLGRRVVLRDVKLLCKRLGFDPPARTLHAFRHTFAVNYLRHGGSVFHLQKVLGHSTLEMTGDTQTDDGGLQAVHQRCSHCWHPEIHLGSPRSHSPLAGVRSVAKWPILLALRESSDS